MSNRIKHSARFSIAGYFLFLLPLTIVVVSGILIYDKLLTKNIEIEFIILFLAIYITVITFLFCFVDIYRRRLMVERPVKQILQATQKIALGDFNTKLIPLHSFYKYDEYDAIMANINKMTEELSKSEILKTDFISNVSHEIKTPLAIIQNYAKALLNNKLDEKTKNKYLQTLISTSNKLSNLISNILKLNKLENQRISAAKENVNVGELLRENILQFENLIESKQIELNCDISDISLNIEISYLEIIFNNLISNAIKFTEPKGIINISLKIHNNYIVFSVKDNGCGMTADVGARIFEKFYQGDTSHSSEGNGLGLALVKKVIDILGGEISVESERGKGSTFTVKLKRDIYE